MHQPAFRGGQRAIFGENCRCEHHHCSNVGVERLLVAFDLRYVDYRNTNGFRDTGFSPQGALRGLGWDAQVDATPEFFIYGTATR